jgi:hypothetical protein
VFDDQPSICIGCGLCCDGSLFGHLAVSDETDLGWPLRSLGVEIIVEADPPVFALPCPAVHEGCCTVFHQHRPRACEQFECDLLVAERAGHVTRADALATIAATVALRDAVRRGEAGPAALQAEVRAHFLARTTEQG